MKIFSWVQAKLNGRHGSSKKAPFNVTTSIDQSSRGHGREEFSDWPNELLAIGTLWNSSFKETKGSNLHDALCPSEGFTQEEIGQLQERLNALFSQESLSAASSTGREHAEFQRGKFLHCSQNSWTEKSLVQISRDDHVPDQAEIDHLLKSICEVQHCNRQEQDAYLDKGSYAMRKKSLSFLLEKAFAWRSGFAPGPGFRDPLSYPESRMDKILRAIISKKIHPQNSCHTMSRKKRLVGRCISRLKNDGGDDNSDDLHKGNNGSKWVKTDTEYIVLEI